MNEGSEQQSSDIKSDPRTPRTMFLGNIPVGTKQKAISRLASKFGKVESVRLRGVVPESPGIPKRAALHTDRLHSRVDSYTAYVVFSEPGGEDAMREACTGLNMSVFKGHNVRATPADESDCCPRRSLFVGNLPADASEQEFLGAFLNELGGSEFKIVGARLVRDKETGMCRGFGFVTFNEELAVRHVLNLQDKIKVKGRAVRLTKALKKANKNTRTAKRRLKGITKKRTGSIANRSDKSKKKSSKTGKRRTL